jgi:hypothetical protein
MAVTYAFDLVFVQMLGIEAAQASIMNAIMHQNTTPRAIDQRARHTGKRQGKEGAAADIGALPLHRKHLAPTTPERPLPSCGKAQSAIATCHCLALVLGAVAAQIQRAMNPHLPIRS